MHIPFSLPASWNTVKKHRSPTYPHPVDSGPTPRRHGHRAGQQWNYDRRRRAPLGGGASTERLAINDDEASSYGLLVNTCNFDGLGEVLQLYAITGPATNYRARSEISRIYITGYDRCAAKGWSVDKGRHVKFRNYDTFGMRHHTISCNPGKFSRRECDPAPTELRSPNAGSRNVFEGARRMGHRHGEVSCGAP
jgi:hypothetical protein